MHPYPFNPHDPERLASPSSPADVDELAHTHASPASSTSAGDLVSVAWAVPGTDEVRTRVGVVVDVVEGLATVAWFAETSTVPVDDLAG